VRIWEDSRCCLRENRGVVLRNCSWKYIIVSFWVLACICLDLVFLKIIWSEHDCFYSTSFGLRKKITGNEINCDLFSCRLSRLLLHFGHARCRKKKVHFEDTVLLSTLLLCPLLLVLLLKYPWWISCGRSARILWVTCHGLDFPECVFMIRRSCVYSSTSRLCHVIRDPGLAYPAVVRFYTLDVLF
jgi:hypothetical protein